MTAPPETRRPSQIPEKRVHSARSLTTRPDITTIYGILGRLDGAGSQGGLAAEGGNLRCLSRAPSSGGVLSIIGGTR
jgi:hypothetical protein